MPLTASGERILADFRSRYGRKKGTRYFYAKMNKDPEQTRKWHQAVGRRLKELKR